MDVHATPKHQKEVQETLFSLALIEAIMEVDGAMHAHPIQTRTAHLDRRTCCDKSKK
jgi:hypothetical protein